MSKESIRTIVVEDEPRILTNLARKIMQLHPRYEIVGTARNGEKALELIDQLHPDVVFSDVYMPRMDGIALTAELKRQAHPPIVAIISGFREFDYVRAAMKNGVQHYLLKPLSDSDLREALNEIQEQLDHSRENETTLFIRKAVEGNLLRAEIPPVLAAKRYHLALLNLGAILNPFEEASIGNQIDSIMALIDPDEVAENCALDRSRLWILNGSSRAQRLVVAEDTGAFFDAARLYHSLEKYAQDYPLTLCSSQNLYALWELHANAQTLSSTIAHCLSLGNSQLLAADASAPLRAVLTREILNAFAGCIHTNRLDIAKENFASLMLSWEKNCCPQFQLESELRQLIQQIAAHSRCAKDENLFVAEHFALSALCSARRPTDAIDEIWTMLTDLLLQANENSFYAEKTVDEIVRYLERNFAQEITVDSIAAKMGFNAVHLNRVFKKQKHLPIIQYLINLRIEKAKQLMHMHPDWPLAVIGESVGYPDPHYFSRIFKKCVGVPPSEWRDSQE